jgi:hypothetical protein
VAIGEQRDGVSRYQAPIIHQPEEGVLILILILHIILFLIESTSNSILPLDVATFASAAAASWFLSMLVTREKVGKAREQLIGLATTATSRHCQCLGFRLKIPPPLGVEHSRPRDVRHHQGVLESAPAATPAASPRRE